MPVTRTVHTVVVAMMTGAFAFACAALAAPSPYRGEEARAIKALSAQEIDDFQNGRGMGLARAAELNDFPGPQHVLDLARELTLTPEQTRQTQAIFAAMKTEASSLGAQLVAREQELDRRFADGSIERAALEALVTEIGVLQARIRFTHLAAHLQQKDLLSQHQIQRYRQLRGYGSGGHDGHHHGQ